MKESYDKPFKTYKEQIEILKDRNVVFKDEKIAEEDICDFSYYSLVNGYKTLFPQKDERFIHSVSFDVIKFIAILDNDLNSIILKYIIYVERSLKSKVSYAISKKYGVNTYIEKEACIDIEDDYLYKNNFMPSPKRDNTLKSIKKSIYDYRDKNKSLCHYLKNHNHVPFWIAINCLTFGDAILLYSILKKEEKEYVVNNLVSVANLNVEEKKDFAYVSLQALRHFRNDVAHGQKVFAKQEGSKLSKRTVLNITNRAITNQRYTTELKCNRLFEILLSLTVMLRNDTRNFFIFELENFISKIDGLVVGDRALSEVLDIPDGIVRILKSIK